MKLEQQLEEIKHVMDAELSIETQQVGDIVENGCKELEKMTRTEKSTHIILILLFTEIEYG